MSDSRKRILCFGDSNTWGYVPGSEGERFAAEVRWPGVLQAALGEEYVIIEEAQNGRTTVLDDPTETICKNGARHLPVILESQAPLDAVILMLGTNDLKFFFGQSARSIAHGAGVLVDRIRDSAGTPDVLLISPPRVSEGICPFGPLFETGAEVSAGFATAYSVIAENRDVAFLDAAEHATCPVPDTIHLDEAGCAALGNAVAAKVRELGW